MCRLPSRGNMYGRSFIQFLFFLLYLSLPEPQISTHSSSFLPSNSAFLSHDRVPGTKAMCMTVGQYLKLTENLLLCEGFQLARHGIYGCHPKCLSEAMGWGLSLFPTWEETEAPGDSLKHNLGRPGHDRNKELMERQLSRKGGLGRGTRPGAGEARLSLGGVAG